MEDGELTKIIRQLGMSNRKVLVFYYRSKAYKQVEQEVSHTVTLYLMK